MRRWATELLSFIGIALILGGSLWIDSSDPFPGTVAVLPVAGTMLLLLAGGGPSLPLG